MKLYKSIRKCNYYLVVSLFSLLFSFNLLAKPVALVSSVSGDVFYSHQGVTKALQLGMHIPDGADVFGELGSQLTITDYYDHRYHLASSGHIKVSDNSIVLISGYLWIQSFQEAQEAHVKTANASINYIKGDAIVSFDSVAGKTQLLVVNGDFAMANSLNSDLKTSVFDGQFSFIGNENDAPRSPTFCGFDSFKRVVTLFGGVSPIEKGAMARMKVHSPIVKKVTRKIASVPKIAPVIQKPAVALGTITLRLNGAVTNRAPASIATAPKEDKYVAAFYTEQLNKLKKIPSKPKKGRSIATKRSDVKVRIFGGSIIKEHKSPKKMREWKVKVKKKVGVRAPASVTNYSDQVNIKINSEFENSMSKQLKQQMRHSTEVNRLIDELNSYDQDFTKSY